MPGDKPSSRRDFLRGRSAARALLDAARGFTDEAAKSVDELTPRAPRLRRFSADAAHIHASRRAMACDFAIQYHAADSSQGDAVLAALDLVEEFEDQLSIYREHTEVSAINRTAAEHAVEVEPRLFSLLELCAWLHATTGGAFDVTSGPLSRTWGFLRREGRLPGEDEIAATLENVGFQHVELDPDHRTIRFLKPGIEINFNAVGKGYALDRVAELLGERGLNDYLCHGGRSSVLARGRDRGGDAGGWAIGVPHPHKPGEHVGEIVLRDEALGTSGAGTQFFEAGGRRYGHLIDPRTGWPTEGVYAATAVAPTAAEADALATAFYINGPGGAAEYCAEHKSVAAVLVCPRQGTELEEIDVHAFNLASDRWIPGPV
jgi:thiamine biosynthesis lipoprotein